MKILLVSLSNRGGGASRAIDSLAIALKENHIDVEMLTYDGVDTQEYSLHRINNNRLATYRFILKNKLSRWFMSFFDNPSHDYRSINIFPSPMLRRINQSDADIVHIHWIGGEMMSISQIGRIKKPVVWTLHDSWMLHGCYHIEPHWYEPFQKAPKSNWLDKWVLKRKQKSFSKIKIHFTTPSHWLTTDFENTYLNNGKNTSEAIRNVIDTTVWKPIPKDIARQKLGFEDNKKHVLFIANNLLTSFNKGYQHVQKLLDMCKEDNILFHFVGTDIKINNPKVEVHGKMWEAEKLAYYYSACDVTLQPSFWENLSYVSVESILCGTPILCFATTGLDEIVENGINGYKARKFDVTDLYHGLKILTNTSFEKPVHETIPDYLPEINIERYIKLYHKVLTK